MTTRFKSANPLVLYAVMKAYHWDSLIVQGLPLQPPAAGPHRFIPLFETHAQAVAFADGNESVIQIVGLEHPDIGPSI